FDRHAMETLVAGLAPRVFVMSDAHEDAPIVLQSRWALSYLRGPLTRAQIATLTASSGARPARDETTPKVVPGTTFPAGSTRPVLPPDVPEVFVTVAGAPAAGGAAVYEPRILARAKVHHVSAKDGVDLWRDVALLAPLSENGPAWDSATPLDAASLVVSKEPAPGASFGPLPAAATSAKSLAAWGRDLAAWFVRAAPLTLLLCPELDATSQPGE